MSADLEAVQVPISGKHAIDPSLHTSAAVSPACVV